MHKHSPHRVVSAFSRAYLLLSRAIRETKQPHNNETAAAIEPFGGDVKSLPMHRCKHAPETVVNEQARTSYIRISLHHRPPLIHRSSCNTNHQTRCLPGVTLAHYYCTHSYGRVEAAMRVSRLSRLRRRRDGGYSIQQLVEQHLLEPPLLFCRWSCEFGSGKLSRGTKCITVVLPKGNPSAPNVTLQCRKRPW